MYFDGSFILLNLFGILFGLTVLGEFQKVDSVHPGRFFGINFLRFPYQDDRACINTFRRIMKVHSFLRLTSCVM